MSNKNLFLFNSLSTILPCADFIMKNNIYSEIYLLRGDNVDTDIISEISQKTLGLIQHDQIVIKIPK